MDRASGAGGLLDDDRNNHYDHERADERTKREYGSVD